MNEWVINIDICSLLWKENVIVVTGSKFPTKTDVILTELAKIYFIY